MKYNLIQGDCLEKLKDVPDGSIDFVCVDLPYGMMDASWDNVIPFEPMWQQINRVVKNNGCVAMFGIEPFSSYLRMSNIKNYKYDIVWKKEQSSNPMLAKKRILPIHELISFFYKKQPTYNPQFSYGFANYSATKTVKKRNSEIYKNGANKDLHRECSDGSRYPVSVVEFKSKRKKNHPTEKPVDLLEFLIRTFTNENETVLDFTMGSGSTGVACVHTNRNFIGIELDEKYFEIAKTRIKSEETKKENEYDYCK